MSNRTIEAAETICLKHNVFKKRHRRTGEYFCHYCHLRTKPAEVEEEIRLYVRTPEEQAEFDRDWNEKFAVPDYYSRPRAWIRRNPDS